MSKLKQILEHGLRLLAPRITYSKPLADSISDQFNKLYYDTGVWGAVTWRGSQVFKNPCDLWSYQEIIHQTQPDLIIELGTAFGGSSAYFADLLSLIYPPGKVVTVDINKQTPPFHPRVQYIIGSSTDINIYNQIVKIAASAKRVMVVIDSNHAEYHVSKELEMYHMLVTKGCYMVVEDTNLNGHPVMPSHGPGPAEAVAKFLKDNNRFEVDAHYERHHLTFNKGGYLKCLR